MKKLFALLALLCTAVLSAQDISGTWHGLLSFPAGKLHLDINLTRTATGYTGTMDSPDQGAKGIPLTTVVFEDNTFAFLLPEAEIDYKGTFANNMFKGTFTQKGMAIPLDLGRNEIKPVRPQEPVKPYPYYDEDVTFKNSKGNTTLAGTLTLPKKGGTNYPAVILITGSGPQNRNEELLEHKPFLVIADYLTRHGIAVLRYDDRGNGSSTGNFETATTQDFATDAEAAFAYLKTRLEINKSKIGLAGHSEGGTIAPIVAVNNPDVAFVVLLAGTAIPGDELMMLQNYLVGKANGMPEEELTKLGNINKEVYKVIKEETDTKVLQSRLTAVFNKDMRPLLLSKGIPQNQVDPYIAMQVTELSGPWYSNFIRYDPYPTLEKVKCPILALNGEKDLQVAPQANLNAIKRAGVLGGNKKVTVKQLPGLNHLFQQSATGSPAEYGDSEETFSPMALKEIGDWIAVQVK